MGFSRLGGAWRCLGSMLMILTSQQNDASRPSVPVESSGSPPRLSTSNSSPVPRYTALNVKRVCGGVRASRCFRSGRRLRSVCRFPSPGSLTTFSYKTQNCLNSSGTGMRQLLVFDGDVRAYAEDLDLWQFG